MSGSWVPKARAVARLFVCLSLTPAALAGQTCQTPSNRPTGSLSASADLIRATTDDNKIGASGRFVLWSGASLCPAQSLRRWRTLATLGADYRKKKGSDGTTTITRSYRADLAQTLMLGRGVFLGGATQLFHNNSLGVELQQVYRLSAGVALGALEIGAGPAYVDQDFGDAGASSSFGAVALHETAGFTMRYPVAGTMVTESVRALLPVGEDDAKQLALSAHLIVPLTASLGVSWSLWRDYIENAPVGRNRTYLRTSFGFSWAF